MLGVERPEVGPWPAGSLDTERAEDEREYFTTAACSGQDTKRWIGCRSSKEDLDTMEMPGIEVIFHKPEITAQNAHSI